MLRIIFVSGIVLLISASCQDTGKKVSTAKPVRLVTLDPGHFHAALVQKSMYQSVDSVVHVYAPAGPDLQLHLDRINSFNARNDDPTEWKEEVYTGDDFFNRMLEEREGNVVVIAGNNQKKTEYIFNSLKEGFHVLSDKPMVIDNTSFRQLEEAFEMAERNKLLLYDIMTERFEITTMLQKEFSTISEIFGTLERGTPEDPAISIKGVHFFYKYVSGNILKRPPWFMDVAQEGEGIVDVTTHLVDLVQWECFPGQIIDYKKDIELVSARRWATNMSLSEFHSVTQLDRFPDYLQKALTNDTVLQIFCNGEINYKINGVQASVAVEWKFRAAEGGDTHYSLLRGTKANLIIRQGAEQQYQPSLYIEPTLEDASFKVALRDKLKSMQSKYPGIEVKETGRGWQVVIPDKFKEGHEAHFARVTQNFLEYLQNNNMPAWEVPNMLAKYYVTTEGLALAMKK